MQKFKQIHNKRGAYFFVIDSIIAGIIIIAGLFFIFGSYTSKPDQESTLRNSEDFLNYIQTTKVREHNSVLINSMVNNGKIGNPENTLYMQLLDFYYRNQTSQDLTDFCNEITKGFISYEKSYSMYLDSTLIATRFDKPQESARISISSKRIAHYVINETSMFGPATFEFRIWI